MNAKFEIINHGCLRLHVGARTVAVQGEAYFDGPVVFDADSSSIERWDDGTAVTADEKAEIVKLLSDWRSPEGGKIEVTEGETPEWLKAMEKEQEK